MLRPPPGGSNQRPAPPRTTGQPRRYRRRFIKDRYQRTPWTVNANIAEQPDLPTGIDHRFNRLNHVAPLRK